MQRIFEWDPVKAARNLKKHGIGFDEAAFVFDDPCCISEQDRVEDGEERWQTIGVVGGCLLLSYSMPSRFMAVGLMNIGC